MSAQDASSTSPAAAADGVTVRFWAAARAASGVETELVAAGELADVIGMLATKYPELSRLLPRCSLLLDGVAVGRADVDSTEASAGSTVEILPPFAGG